MTKTPYLIFALAIIMILVGGFAFMNSSNKTSGTPAPTSTPINQETTDNTILYDGKTFSPSTLTVKVGTTVTFKNVGKSDDMWPASAPHPTHTNLPDFDSKRDIKIGESYSYTFTKVGDWGFHNHENPTANGKIVVQ